MESASKFNILITYLVLAFMALAVLPYSASADCGDGKCSSITCMALDPMCQAAESHETCPQDCGTKTNCGNGILDVEEKSIDCGGICWSLAEEVCDGKDNDKDCSVDEGPYDTGNICDPSTWTSFCYNGVLDRFERKVDCGDVCRTNAVEICDGKDNDKDCQIDENCGVPSEGSSVGAPGGGGGVATSPIAQPKRTEAGPSCNDGLKNQDEDDACRQETRQEATEQPVTIPATPAPTSVPLSAPMPAPEPQPEPGTPVEVPATPAEEAPAVGDVDIASLTDDELDAFIEQNGGADFIRQMRKLAEEKGVYVPKGESDAQFGRKYVRYFFKHQSELAAKFDGKEPTEDELVGILKQFSEEAYPKPVQQQSFFSKVAGFFKRMFR